MAAIIRANARSLPLADNTVDLIVTSPPYFALRSYTDGGEHYAGQIGDEPSPAEFVDSLIEVTRECMRVLKQSGSLWVNLGDKYSQRVAIRPSSHQDGLFPDREDLPKDWKRDKARGLTRMPYQNVTNPSTGAHIPEKSLMGLPWRYALRCIDELGLILRAEVIWSKPNGLPESVADRVRRSHEQWFHFTLQPRYFSAVDEIREEHVKADREPRPMGTRNKTPRHTIAADYTGWKDHSVSNNPLGKLPGSVWTIPTEPLKVPDHLGIDHFAAFPTEWPRRIIQGWSPAGICTACGEGRRPVSERDPIDPRYLASNSRGDGRGNVEIRGVSQSSILRTGLQAGQSPATHVTGYACACPAPTAEHTIEEFDYDTGERVIRVVERPDPSWVNPAPTRPAVILDPFGGTGTTALVAKALGRHGISVDMSADYCRLAAWRTTDPDQMAKASRVDKPPKQVTGQADLFDLLEGPAA